MANILAKRTGTIIPDNFNAKLTLFSRHCYGVQGPQKLSNFS
jgi:hypothetical protein